MKCGTTTCTGDRLYRIHWPGKTVELCLPCSARATRIADAMGFGVTVDPIDPGTPMLGVAVLLYLDGLDGKDPPS